MDVADDFRAGDRQNVPVVQQILFIVSKSGAAGIGLAQSVSPDRGPHCAIEDKNSLRKGFLDFNSSIGLWHVGKLAIKSPTSRNKSSYQDMTMGEFTLGVVNSQLNSFRSSERY